MGIKIIMPPLKIPAEAKPAIARPTMNTTDDGATAQMREPISNTITQIM